MNNNRLRQQIAQEAARILAEEGVSDFRFAKQKAATRYNAGTKTHLPNNSEIESALAEYLRLFRSDSQPMQIRTMREVALRIMSQLQPFQPRLVGAVLRGTAEQHTPIELHLFADSPEEIAMFLMDRRIPYDDAEHRWQQGETSSTTPVFHLEFETYQIKLFVFPLLGIRTAPLCPVEKRPMRRADKTSVESLLASQ